MMKSIGYKQEERSTKEGGGKKGKEGRKRVEESE